jgi:hypothetical protein
VLARCRQSGARWFLSTTFPSVAANYDVTTGDFRAVNLERPPFDLPPPLRLLDDSFHANPDCRLGVWDFGARGGDER